MAHPDMAQDIAEQLFIEQVDNYLRKDLDAMLAHYAPEPRLLFWNAEGDVITDHDHLRRWYEELFDQFDIESVRYNIESVYPSASMIVCGSLWVVSTSTVQNGEKITEEQSLRATHVLRQHDGNWVIEHLHASASRHALD